VQLSIHVDDIIRDFAGDSCEQVLDDVISSNRVMQLSMKKLAMPLAADKEQVVANRPSLAIQVQQVSLAPHRKPLESVRRLGADFHLRPKWRKSRKGILRLTPVQVTRAKNAFTRIRYATKKLGAIKCHEETRSHQAWQELFCRHQAGGDVCE
jgi:hypothetical protein